MPQAYQIWFEKFLEFYDILNSVCALGQKKKSIGAFLTSVDKKSPASKAVGWIVKRNITAVAGGEKSVSSTDMR